MNDENLTPEPPRRSRVFFAIGILTIAVSCLLFVLSVLGLLPARQSAPAGVAVAVDTQSPPPLSADTQAPFEEKLGIRLTGVNLAVGGTRLDFRYQVVDPRRAILLTNEQYRAYVLDAEGKTLSLPTGPTAAPIQNQSGQMPRQGFTYSRFFPNPNHTVKPGDQVTLVIGPLRESLVVQ